MPVYEFKCDSCGLQIEKYYQFTDAQVAECHGMMRKLLPKFQYTRFSEVYSPGLGKEVNSRGRYKEELKIKSEQVSERTGILHNFQPVDLSDKKALGVTDQGIEDKNPSV